MHFNKSKNSRLILTLHLTILYCFMILKTLSLESKSIMNSKISNALNSFSTESTLQSQTPLDTEHTLSLSGSAMREVETNLIIIGINIETLNLILKDSFTQNSQTSSRVTKVFEQMGIPKNNITTTNYEITPVYENEYFQTNNSYVSVFKGYQVKNQLAVTLSKKRLAADLMDKVVLSGPVLITYVSFGFSEGFIKSVKDSLLEKATLNAYESASSIAKTLGISIEDVKLISINDFQWPMSNQLNFQYEKGNISGAGAKMAPPTFYSGTQWVTINVGVTFVIVKE